MEERQHCSKVIIEKINMFLRLSVEDVSEIVCVGYELVSGGWDQLNMFLRFSLEDGELKDRSLRRRPS